MSRIKRMRIYRRHGPKCRHHGTEDAFSKTNCRCPIYVDGGARGQGARSSMRTRDWARAESRLRKLEEAKETGRPAVTVADACQAFLGDCRRRNLKRSTIRGYEKTLEHLRHFCADQEIGLIAEVTQTVLLQFQNAREVPADEEGGRPRPLEASTVRKELETLRAFFRFQVDQDYAEQNFAKKLRPPKESRRPTMPFPQEDVAALLATAATLEDKNPLIRERTRMRAVAAILTMLYSGLRISDVATLERGRVNLKDGRLLLRMEKTGEPVYVRLALPAIDALKSLPVEGVHFFWSGESERATVTGTLRRTIDRVCRKAGIEGHPHRFRDTFAVRMLEKGVPLDQVSILLGHTSVKTTEKYYAPWVRSRQKLLDQAVAALDFVAVERAGARRLKRVK
jgi:integrase/recombinase XerD